MSSPITQPIYRVAITPFLGLQPNQEGFIDHVTVRSYGVTVGGGMTYDMSEDKRRANTRFRRIIDTVGNAANMNIMNLQGPDGTAKTEASSFSFDVYFDKPELPAITVDGVDLNGADALMHLVAEALCIASIDRVEVFDPTETQGFPKADGGFTDSTIRTGARWVHLDIGALAENVDAAKTHITITVL